MRCSKATSSIVLLICGLILALTNLWVTAARSLIPLAIDAKVVSKERRPEKHPGIDDVYLLTVAGGRTIQVDEMIFNIVAEGDALRKVAWSNQLESGAASIRLQFSRDFYRMIWIMPAAISAATILAALTIRQAARESSADWIAASGELRSG